MKGQELQLDKVKAKLDAINSGQKAPSSLTSMQTELKKIETEIKNTETEYDNLINQINTKQVDLEWAKSSGNQEEALRVGNSLKNLDSDSIITATKLEDLRDKAFKLSTEINNVKLNPSNSVEANQLQKQITLLNSKLQSTKEKANSLKEEIRQTMNQKSGSTETAIRMIGKQATSVGNSVKSGLNKKLDGVGKKVDNVSKKIAQFRRRIMSLVASAVVFNILSSGLRSLQQGFTSLLMSNKDFSNYLNQIKVNLLTAFAPIYNYVLPAINSLMSALSQITGAIAGFVSGLFGKTTSESKKAAQSLYGQAKAYENLGKSAKKGLSSIDEIENLNEDSSASVTPDLNFDTATESSSKLLNFLNEITDLIKHGKWYELGAMIANGINDALNNMNVNSFTKKVSNALQNSVKLFNGIIVNVDWSLMGTKFSDLVVGLLDAFIIAVKILNWKALGQAIGEFITNIDWLEIGIKILELLVAGLNGIYDFVISLFETIFKGILNIDWLKLGTKLVRLLKLGLKLLPLTMFGIFSKALDSILGIDWLKLGTDILNFIMSGMGMIVEKISNIFIQAKDTLMNIDWSEVGLLISQKIGESVDTVVSWISNIGESAYDSLISAFSGVEDFFKNTVVLGIQNAFSNITNWFRDTFSKAWTSVKNVFSSGGQIFNGIKEGILSTFKNVVNSLIRGINQVITIPFNGINTALRKIKNISMPGIGKPFYGMISTISVPKIPYLAKGAVIPPNKEFSAVLGDQKNGRNLEGPESLFRQIVKEESGNMDIDLLLELIRSVNDLANRPIQLDINGQEFARATYQDFKNEEGRLSYSSNVRRR